MDSVIFSIVILFAILALMIAIALRNIRKANQQTTKQYRTYQTRAYNTAGHRYIRGQFSNQLELDMRLPYRRFRQLYPETRWTYEEYKKMQTQTAFRRSFSSQDNKRMVR